MARRLAAEVTSLIIALLCICIPFAVVAWLDWRRKRRLPQKRGLVYDLDAIWRKDRRRMSR